MDEDTEASLKLETYSLLWLLSLALHNQNGKSKVTISSYPDTAPVLSATSLMTWSGLSPGC